MASGHAFTAVVMPEFLFPLPDRYAGLFPDLAVLRAESVLVRQQPTADKIHSRFESVRLLLGFILIPVVPSVFVLPSRESEYVLGGGTIRASGCEQTRCVSVTHVPSESGVVFTDACAVCSVAR